MNIPKEIRTFCPHCKKHTPHSLIIYKAGKRRSTAIGERRHKEDRKGYGGQKYPEQKKTAKTTKKQTIKVKCNECKHQMIRKGIRLRKMEITA